MFSAASVCLFVVVCVCLSTWYFWTSTLIYLGRNACYCALTIEYTSATSDLCFQPCEKIAYNLKPVGYTLMMQSYTGSIRWTKVGIFDLAFWRGSYFI